MSANSPIEWTDHTFNPWWGCVKVSPGCEHCYAETLSARYGHRVWGPAKTTRRRTFGEAHWREPLLWNQAAERERAAKRVFCASMADVFEVDPQLLDARAKLFELIDQTPWLDWLILTKRPENIRPLVPADWILRPRSNVWFGTSVEDQQRARDRIHVLADVPAVVRFLSCEPLLGPLQHLELGAIDWVIVGGESGPAARRMDPIWALSVAEQCARTNTAFFLKQTGAVLASELGLQGKGHDIGRLPPALRKREFPTSAVRPLQPASGNGEAKPIHALQASRTA